MAIDSYKSDYFGYFIYGFKAFPDRKTGPIPNSRPAIVETKMQCNQNSGAQQVEVVAIIETQASDSVFSLLKGIAC